MAVMVTFLLSGCGSSTSTQEIPKQFFEISTLDIYNSENLWYITKSSKLQWASEIIIPSLVSGRIRNINFGLGAQVSPWSLLVQLQDTMSPSGSAIQNAQLSVERAKITEDSTTDDIAQQKRKIEFDLKNVDGTLTGSSTQIQLAKLQIDLSKAEFDYQARLKADAQTNENLITTTKNIQSDLQIILTDTVNETDKLLWITDIYINGEYKDIRIYIWAKDENTKNKVITSFYTISSLQRQLDTMKSANINDKNVSDYLKTYQSIANGLNEHFVLIKQLFVDTIDDARFKTQLMLVQTNFSTLQSKNSGLNASVTNQLNTIRSYFASYEDQQSSLAKQIESLRSQIALTKKSLEDVEFNTSLWAQRSQIWFDSQIKNATLSSQSAFLQLDQANFNQSKFSVTSPLQWFVADVLVDLWQEVTPGTPLVKLVSTQQQVEVTLTSDEIKNIRLWQKVMIQSELWEAQWIIAQVAQTAERSWSFKVIVVLSKNSTIPSGLFITVKIPVQKWTVLLPINALSIVDTNSAVAYFRDGTKIVVQKVTISSIFGDQVEITNQLPIDYELVITDMSNYDEKTMKISKI